MDLLILAIKPDVDSIKTQLTFKSQQAKTEYQIRTDLNCNSVNVVYM